MSKKNFILVVIFIIVVTVFLFKAYSVKIQRQKEIDVINARVKADLLLQNYKKEQEQSDKQIREDAVVNCIKNETTKNINSFLYAWNKTFGSNVDFDTFINKNGFLLLEQACAKKLGSTNCTKMLTESLADTNKEIESSKKDCENIK